ncbi:MAG: type II toxin-antitoxin system HipA family toxin [Desulfobulbaceae bacterium]|nr:type II toxin-antitoxin system HipA family toxin [Desulfobulbaceae bacterium]
MHKDSVSFLELTLHGHRVGFVAGYRSGRNVLIFAPEFRENSRRPTFSLVTHPDFPNAEKLLFAHWVKRQRLHPILSNLLPEGVLREMLALGLKVHIDDEFQLLGYLGRDLPGALVATPMAIEDVPAYVLQHEDASESVELSFDEGLHHFSLAGVQMKFSMLQRDGRYHISEPGERGDWIVKPPSARHKNVPLSEYSAMRLAQLAGVDIPEVRLVEVEKLVKLPFINLPDEKYAFAIRRFDRKGQERIHTEDFAQVLVKYQHEKYDSANYEQIGKVLFNFTGNGLANVQQFARRLLVNILLANGDAHLKNWSLIYPDKITPELSPAYDIVTTRVYMGDERKFALNLGKNKEWYKASVDHFQIWAARADIPWRAVKPHLFDTLDKARTLWKKELTSLPMDDEHKKGLREHWKNLHSEFRI